MSIIKVAIVGIGNCASSLVQGIHYYGQKESQDAIGLMRWELGGYQPGDIDVVAAFDIDSRKVGEDVNRAIFALPNCTKVFCDDIPLSGVRVKMGPVVDGFSEHMKDHEASRTFLLSDEPEMSEDEVIHALKEADAEILLNYLPVGSEKATRFYANCACKAGLAFINCIPVFIASEPEGSWVRQFEEVGLPLIGDDIKAQMGATILHRTLMDLFAKRGVHLDRTYQLNTGGNTDFLNMKNSSRLDSKKISKTEAVQAVARSRIDSDNIHVGPSDYVPWQNDNKVCFLRMEGKLFGDVPVNLELRLSVEDSPNSAGVAIDMIRCAKLALDRGQCGILTGPSAYYCKHPLQQFTDDEALRLLDAFINGDDLEESA